MTELLVTSPYDDTALANIPLDDEISCSDKITQLRNYFQDRQSWLPAHERQKILLNTADLIDGQRDSLARTASEEGGKPIRDSLIEIERAAQGVRIAASTIANLEGKQIPMDLSAAGAHHLAFTKPEPRGILLGISAFNHPFNLAVHQAIPAIAVGCPVLLKPALETPLSSLNLVTLLQEAGLPEAACKTVICDNANAEKLAMSNHISFLSFIGSANVGWYLRTKLAPGVDCALEHGGAAPVLIEPDVDLDTVLPQIVKAAFYHAGQVCVSVQRLFVHQKIVKQVTKRLTSLIEDLKVGHPLDEETDVGPLIRKGETDRVERWVREAEVGGAKIATGGKKLSDSCYEPTLVIEPLAKCKLSRQEVFGPVLSIYGYSDYREAIAAANSLPYCFQAAVYTHHLDTALDCTQRLKANCVLVNEHTAFRVDWMPFGGSELSGLKLGGIPYTMRDLISEKLTVIKSEFV